MDCVYVTNSKNKDLAVDVSTLGCTPLASSTSPLWNSLLIFLLSNYQLLLSLHPPWLSCLQVHSDTPCLCAQLLIRHTVCLSVSLLSSSWCFFLCWFHTRGSQPGLILVPRGYITMPGDTSGCHSWGDIQWERPGTLLNIIQMPRPAPSAKNDLTLDVSSAEFEEH